MSTSSGFCHCCGKSVPLLTDVDTDESVCTICRSYDVTRDSIRNAATPKLQLHELANFFESAFDVHL